MQLVLSIGDKVLDVVPLQPEKVKADGYLAALCRLLVVKHELTILAHLREPTFYIEVSSTMGNKKPQ